MNAVREALSEKLGEIRLAAQNEINRLVTGEGIDLKVDQPFIYLEEGTLTVKRVGTDYAFGVVDAGLPTAIDLEVDLGDLDADDLLLILDAVAEQVDADKEDLDKTMDKIRDNNY